MERRLERIEGLLVRGPAPGQEWLSIRQGDTEGALVDVPVVQMADQDRLVRRAELR
jgi:hypothetical protein